MNIKNIKKKTALYAAALVAAMAGGSCSDWYDYHPYDTHFSGERGLTERNTAEIERMAAGKDTLCFAFVSDSHLWQRNLKDIISDINQRDSVDFVIHGGDMTDCATTREYEWGRDIMQGLTKPWVALIGNHDCLGTGYDTYKAMFGNENFSFVAGRVKFVCINTNAMEYDYAAPIPDFTFIENEMKSRRDEFDRTILAMHAKPGTEPFNNNLYTIFEWYAKSLPSLMFCLCGHEHNMSITDLYGDGNLYFCAPGCDDRAYFIFTVYPDRYEYQLISL